jgi:hypothetical protein
MASVSSAPAPLTECPNGGITVKSGIDKNLNGLLDDPGEVTLVQYVCNGAPGASGLSALVAIVDEAAGSNCSAGGKKVTSGRDGNGNGILEPGEVTATGFICNGSSGAPGANSLLAITTEPAGAACAAGGKKVVSWLDTIANGLLDTSETAFTNYVCNGPGTVVIQSITASPAVVRPGQVTALAVSATDGAGSTLTYSWTGPGSFATPGAASTSWTAPATVGSSLVSVQVSNGPSTVTGYASILVSAAPTGPIVTSVSPEQARVGQEVVITGAGFGASQGASTVSIGGVSPASVTSWSEFQIRATVPAGAGTGSVVVTVGGAPSSPGFIVVPWAQAGNVAISTALYGQGNPQLVADGNGGAIMVWQSTRVGTGFDIMAQRVNSAGVPQWAADGVVLCAAAGDQTVPQLVSDGSGGAIVAWEDRRSGTYDVYAQRVNGLGQPQWALNGVAIAAGLSTTAAGLDQVNVQLVASGSGGAILAWGDYRSGTSWDIYAQRVNGLGQPQWTASGVAIAAVTGLQLLPQLASDGADGAILVWEDSRTGTADIYAQRVSGAGAPLWTANGVVISNAVEIQSRPQLVADGAGGAIIVWYDFRSVAVTSSDVYAQRVSSAGIPQWTANGVAIATAIYGQELPRLVGDGSGGAIIVFEDTVAAVRDISAQRINGAGALLWTAKGVAISKAADYQASPQLIADGSGGAIITWQDNRSGTNTDIYAQRVNGAGTTQWIVDGVAVCTAAGNQFQPQLVADGSGGAIVVWTDFRSGGAADIYAQGLTADGAQ